MTSRLIGIKEFRQNLAQVTDDARKKNECLIVLRNNKPLFQVRPLDDDEGVFTEEFAAEIRQGLKDIKEGRVHTQEEVMKHFGIK